MGVAWCHVMESHPGEVVVCPGVVAPLHSSLSLEESKDVNVNEQYNAEPYTYMYMYICTFVSTGPGTCTCQ